MAGTEIKGFEDLKRNVDHIRKDILERALIAAENAAAEVIKRAVEAAAPRKTGQLARSVITYESIDRKALSGSARKRLLIGPGKKKGFYGFFLEKGWRAGGPRRLARKASGNTHSQSGSESFRNVPAPHPDWFSAAAKAAEAEAYEAGVKAFQDILEKELAR